MKSEERRVKCLERRMNFLLQRTDNGTNRTLSYDCEEIYALKWAIGILRAMMAKPEAPRLPIRSEDIA